MSDTTNATVSFDDTRAKTYSPNKVLKYARIIEVPDGQKTVFDAEWGSKQTMEGTYVEIFDPETGKLKYGSGYQEWMNTNVPADDVKDGWYKSTTVEAYQADAEGDLVTVLSSGVVETTKHVNVGDWLVKQRDGEVMCVSAKKFPTLYDVMSAC